jgi:hypothetical protein
MILGMAMFLPLTRNQRYLPQILTGSRNRVSTGANNQLLDWDTNVNSVIDNLSKYYFNVVGIQVNCPTTNTPAYQAFKDQLSEITRSVTAERFPYSDMRGVFVEANNELKIDERVRGEFGCSGVIYSPPGQHIDPDIVTNKMTTTLNNITSDDWKKQVLNLYIKLYPKYLSLAECRCECECKINCFRRIFLAILNCPDCESGLVQFVETGALNLRLSSNADAALSLKNRLFYDVVMLSNEDLRTLRNALNILVPSGGSAIPLAQMRINMYDNWTRVLTQVLRLYSPGDTAVMNRLSFGELSKILTGTPGPRQFSSFLLGNIRRAPNEPGGMANDLFASYMSSFVLTKYCIEVLLSPNNPKPTSLPAWFNNYNGIVSMFLRNSLGIANPTTQQISRVIIDLPGRLNGSFFNLEERKFRIPMEVSARQKQYEWVDCRIFSNDVTYQKFVCTIREILGLPNTDCNPQ